MLAIVPILLAEHRSDIAVCRGTQPFISMHCTLRTIMFLTYRDAYWHLCSFCYQNMELHGHAIWGYSFFSRPNGNYVAGQYQFPLAFACILFARYGTTWSSEREHCHQKFSWPNSNKVSELPLDVETVCTLHFQSGQFSRECGNTLETSSNHTTKQMQVTLLCTTNVTMI